MQDRENDSRGQISGYIACVKKKWMWCFYDSYVTAYLSVP